MKDALNLEFRMHSVSQVIGTVLPLVTGAALTMVYGKPFLSQWNPSDQFTCRISRFWMSGSSHTAFQLERRLHQRVRARGSFAQWHGSFLDSSGLDSLGVGIALRLLGEAGVLQENFGQACALGACRMERHTQVGHSKSSSDQACGMFLCLR